VIHKIKGLYDNGNGLSIRALSKELEISRNHSICPSLQPEAFEPSKK